MSHPVTRALAQEGSPASDRPYKHREDLIDAVVAAWTGLLWMAYGFEQCQVLGANDVGARVATIIAPARPEQRGSTSPTRNPNRLLRSILVATLRVPRLWASPGCLWRESM